MVRLTCAVGLAATIGAAASLGCGTPGGVAPGAAGPLRAGAAAVDMALPAGTSLAGYGNEPRRVFTDPPTAPLLTLGALLGTCVDVTPGTAAALFRPALGTRDPVGARALVLSNGARSVAFVKLDTVGAPRRLRSELVPAAQALGIAPEDLVVVATHTHSGPGGLSEDPFAEVAAADCFSAAVHQAALAAARQALEAAHAALQPAALGVGVASETGVTFNRSRETQPAFVDPEIGVVKVTSTAGAPIAALFNFAIHGTSFGADNMKFSADNMGAIEDAVEAGLPGAVAIFTNGAEGDVAPVHRGPLGVAQTGQLVGADVLALWPSIPTQTSLALAGAYHEVSMPAPTYNTGAGCLPIPGGTSTLCDFIPGLPVQLPLSPTWVPATLPFQALRVGDTLFAAVPGEPTTEIGLELKKRAADRGFAHGFVLGLANDHGGYFTTAAEYESGSYEAKATIYGPATGSLVVDGATAAMDALP